MNSTKQQNSYLGNNFMLLSIDTPAPVNYDMGKGVYGSYDGIRLIANKYDGWRKQPADVPLLKDKLFVPQGTPLPLANEMVHSQIPTNSMFYFARNQAKPECCPSTFSTSTGCVCTTPQQRQFVGVMRGQNKDYPNGQF
jgi:hypothetical protein